MYGKLATLRSKGAIPQRGKKLDHERFSSHNLSTEVDNWMEDEFYFSQYSMPAFSSTPEGILEESASLSSKSYSTSSLFSQRNSNLHSFKSSSSDTNKESFTHPSPQFMNIIGNPSFISFEEAEEQFLEDYEGYFLHLSVDNVPKDQYPMLETSELIYLDHATCPLYSRFQVQQYMKFLLDETESFRLNYIVDQQVTLRSRPYIDPVYHKILNILNTTLEDYSVVFTPGLASCYRLFTEMLELKKGSLILASPDHHSSVQYILKAAAQCNAKIVGIPLKERDLSIDGTEMHKFLRKKGWSSQGSGVLMYSAQTLSTGMCHSMSWITSAQQNGWKVLLDVSSSLPMISIDLSTYHPEFVIGSLHHMLGYPTGLCFILVQRCSYSICTKQGCRELQFIEHPEHGKSVHVATEGENLTTHLFAATSFGFDHLESIGITPIQRRVESLIAWLIKTLKSLCHKMLKNPLIQLYGSLDVKYRGSIMAFNILDPTGHIFPARAVQQLALKDNIVLGCCSLIDVKHKNLFQPKSNKLMECVHLDSSLRNLRVLRLSLGPVSAFNDAYRLVLFISKFREENYMSYIAAGYAEEIENEC